MNTLKNEMHFNSLWYDGENNSRILIKKFDFKYKVIFNYDATNFNGVDEYEIYNAEYKCAKAIKKKKPISV